MSTLTPQLAGGGVLLPASRNETVIRFTLEKSGLLLCVRPLLRYKLSQRYQIVPAYRPANGRDGTVAIGSGLVKKSPNPIDRHVGSRVRMRRVMLGMSQEKLGDALGLTFQQVQKYEKGINRIGASRLQQISRTLDVPPAYFFEGAPSFEPMPSLEPGFAGVAEDSKTDYIADFLSTAEGLHLNIAFARIHNPKIRKRIVDLVCSLAGEDPDALSTRNSADSSEQ